MFSLGLNNHNLGGAARRLKKKKSICRKIVFFFNRILIPVLFWVKYLLLFEDSLGFNSFVHVGLYEFTAYNFSVCCEYFSIIFSSKRSYEFISFQVPRAWKFSPVSQTVFKADSQSEFDVDGTEVAWFLDKKFVSILLNWNKIGMSWLFFIERSRQVALCAAQSLVQSLR